MLNLDIAFSEANPVIFRDICGGRGDSKDIDNGISRHQAGLDTLDEELAQRDEPAPAEGPARRDVAAIYANVTTVTVQQDALIVRRDSL